MGFTDLASPMLLLVFISTVGSVASIMCLWKSAQGFLCTQDIHVIVNSQRTGMESQIEHLTMIRESLNKEVLALKGELSDVKSEVSSLQALLTSVLQREAHGGRDQI